MKLGEFELAIISDGYFRLDGGAMFGVVPRPLWEKKLPPDERNRVRLAMNCLLIQAHGKNIIVDAGIGEKYTAKFQDIYGIEHTTTLPTSLRARGLALEDVDVVVDTHLHFDHCGWNTSRAADGSLRPTFPRATYWIPRGEWEHGLAPSERDRASYVRENFCPLEGAAQIHWIEKDEEIVPDVEVVRIPGHTPHMRAVRVRSRGQTAVYFCDLVPTTAHLPYAWMMGYDLEPLVTLEQKKRWLPLAAREGWLCFFCHDPAIPAAYLEEREGCFEPVPCRELVTAGLDS